jgi:prepilin-type N-terminal cleavage/methylation domain-containing protein/prepilin-type processing-associated H-X9-DG protein
MESVDTMYEAERHGFGMRRPITEPRSSTVHRQAFTLIELLVVIALVALLASLLLPALHRARDQARAVACSARIKQWGTILALYLEDHEGRFPSIPEPYPGLSLLRGLHINAKTDPNAHVRYHGVQTEGAVCCPMATKTTGKRALVAPYLEVNAGGTFAAWEIVKPVPVFRGSYGLNRNVFLPLIGGAGSSGGTLRETDVFSLRRSGRIPVLLDTTSPSCGMLNENGRPPETEPSGPGGGMCINRHDTRLNALFLDWSVRPVGLKELWTLKWHLQFNTAGPWTKAGGVKPEDWPMWMRNFKDY